MHHCHPGHHRSLAAPIGKLTNARGHKPLLILGFGVLPFRALLYTLLHSALSLIAVQVLDGVANAIWCVVSILVVADRTRGSGHFNLAQGALVTDVGLGAAFSTVLGGHLISLFSYNVSFLTLGMIALVAASILVVLIPETRLSGEPATSEETQRSIP